MKLFEPIQIGSMKLKNRIVMPAMHLGYADQGYVNQRIIDFYAERAKNEVGLILVGGCWTELLGKGMDTMLRIDSDEAIPGLSKLAKAIHEGGAKCAAQLYHSGRYAFSMIIGQTPVSASAVQSKFTGETPRAMTKEEIIQTEKNYGEAALRAKKAGFDAVELIASAGYLIPQFLSPLTNKRDDEYGGDLKARTRFGVECIQAIKDRVGDDYPLIMRISGDDMMPGGNTYKEVRVYAPIFAEAGVDMFNVTGGWHESTVPQITMNVPRGTYVWLAENVKEVVDVPVMACNRITDPLLAEHILLDNKADLVGIGRALICDPEWARKAKEGRFKEIRQCLGCNQGCFDHVFLLKPVECLANAAAGREAEYQIKPAAKRKKVLIIGGGPAGMEAARVAKLRGHEVTLYEKSHSLGGQLNLAAAPQDRREFKNLVEYLSYQMSLLGINVVLGKEVTPEVVKKLKPDVIIVATGGRPLIPNIPGVDGPNVVKSWDVLAGKVAVGKKVVVVGGGGVGCETALYLTDRGSITPEQMIFLVNFGVLDLQTAYDMVRKTRDVTIVEMMDKMGADIGRTCRWTILKTLSMRGVKMLTNSKVAKINDRGVILENGDILEADTVVLAVGTVPNNELIDQLEGLAPEVYAIGDCVQPRKAFEAVHEAAEIARKI
ncbi:MAG: FAD-dependent oxidoreductase [Candidatus Freyarchaeota archaeon]|nr:FAD-dependent oxidoreductase [Candidatus Jordarchaeia archaeon]MBS7269626.1 FAD-dependent oxidoreductase [Candidatus Jordarchaeia archaeon]